jgi:hypothetical protein
MKTRRLRTALILMAAALAACPFFACGSRPDSGASLALQEAQNAFLDAATEADYLQVAALYGRVLENGFVNGAVLFNQGNAYMRAGRPGLAIASYRRAERFRPRDPYLEANLELALGAGSGSRSRTLLDHFFFWQDWLGFHEKVRAAASAAAAALILGLAGLFLGRSRKRRTFTLGVLFITLLLTASAALDWYRHDLVRSGVVVAEEVEARKGNAESFAPAFSTPLEEGVEFTVLEERGGWLHIRLRTGPEGWIPRGAAVII